MRPPLLCALLLLTLALPASAVDTKPCQDCGGKGKVVCTYCQGKGEARTPARHTRFTEQTCDKCRGTGSRLCFPCGGAGDLAVYPAPGKDAGALKLKFEVKSRKKKPAPSWIEIVVDGAHRERIDGRGRDRIYDFKEIPLAPGDRHRLYVRVHFGRAIGGFHDGEVFVHRLRVEPGRLTTNEEAKRGILPRDDDKVEDWGETYRGIYRTMEETGAFRIVDRR